MNSWKWASLFLLATLMGCEEQPLQAVGQLESDRIELVAEFSEPIVEIAVTEGDALSVGTLLLQQDTRRVELRIREAQANIARIEAVLAEQISGPRVETIDAARANLKAAEIERDYRSKESQRLDGLRARNLTSVESVDAAQNLLQSARVKIEYVSAQLAELEAGTRGEQIQQTNALLLQAQTQLASLELDRQRLSIIVPRDSIVDSLPFEVGERPRQGDVVAVLLSGEQPYARLYIPEPLRIQFRPGTQLQIRVDGLEGTLTGTVRRVASEASFTPYFALTERDRGRLSYVAEVTLPRLPDRLPDGVPVQAVFQ
ncbi:MAG: HlyD family efflux transporter periplasmic adaptor subunit [Pseudohongiella sp.]|jgi:HlyD family secretion protein|nr:HlyD family efflux transporter periplasmic adaptor subunit [Pseudohongiella sp.]